MKHLLNLLAAIALLVWGTHMVRTGVLRVFGANLRNLLAHSMSNRFSAALSGLGVTALVQSSTATSLMTSAFVGQGLISLPAALAVMRGADVGTALMAVLFSTDLSWLSPLFIFVGVVLFITRQDTTAGRIGRVLIGLGVMLLGFAFLYVPILLLMFYSFNSSRLAMVWAGFSTRAYSDLFADRALMDAMWTSLVVAFWTACTATVLGTLAAMVMTRFKRFRGKPLFGALVTAPLVMPDVILGFSLMALLASMGAIPGFPARGLTTIWIAHVTFTLCFVTVVVSSRLQEMDLSLEEAAMDLGASRLTVFGRITLPIIAPALVAGWLLAFTLSLDDVVVASFVATPGSTTLPMKVFASVRMGISPKINALATLLVSAVSIAAVIGWYINARAEKRRQRDLQLARQENG